VDVFVAVGIPQMRSLAAHNEWRIAAHGAKRAHRRVNASGNHLLGTPLQFQRLVGFARHGSSCGGDCPWKGQYSSTVDRDAGRMSPEQVTLLTAAPAWDSSKIHLPETSVKHGAGRVWTVHALLTGRVFRTASGGSGLS